MDIKSYENLREISGQQQHLLKSEFYPPLLRHLQEAKEEILKRRKLNENFLAVISAARTSAKQRATAQKSRGKTLPGLMKLQGTWPLSMRGSRGCRISPGNRTQNMRPPVRPNGWNERKRGKAGG